MQLPIEEYFKYHPPTTPERIALYDRVNRDSLEICKAFIESKDDVQSLAIRDAAMLLADEVCLDKTCNDWAKGAIEEASKIAASYLNKDIKAEAILMHVQQFRMFLNQGIVVDELKRKQLAEGMAAVTADDIAEIFRMHGETVPKSNDPERFNIAPEQFVKQTKQIIDAFNETIIFDLVKNRFTVYLTEAEEQFLEKYRKCELTEHTLAGAWKKGYVKTEQILDIINYENHPDLIDRYRSGEWTIDLLARKLDLTIVDTYKVLDNIFGSGLKTTFDAGASSKHPDSAFNAKAIDIVPPSSLPKYFERHKHEMMSFHVKDGQILSIEPMYKGVHLTLDGDKWCALIGQNLQVGIAGFGDDPISALSDLYAKLQGIEIDNIYGSETTQDEQDSLCVRYTTKEIISTYIKSILPVAETIEKHETFIKAYGQALFDRDEDGLSDREKLLAMNFADSLPEEEEIGGGT